MNLTAMKIYSAEQIKAWDEFTINHEPIKSIDLMERAAKAFVDCLGHKKAYRIHVFCGPGNNGGDGLAISRLLKADGHEIKTYSFNSSKYSEDYSINLDRLEGEHIVIESSKNFPQIKEDEIIIDALFGSGLNKPLEDLYLEIIESINNTSACTYSVDIPSGLFTDAKPEGQWVTDSHVITFQVPKQNLLLPDSRIKHLDIVNIGLADNYDASSEQFYVSQDDVQSLIKQRGKFSHKGSYGHGLLIGGSYGKMGAIQLSARAALRSGIGLLSAFIPKSGYVVMQTSVPECMTITAETVQTISSLPEIDPYNAIAIGPGLDTLPDCLESLAILLIANQNPMIIDADAINLIAQTPHLIQQIPKHSILTPHPKEFDRLVGDSLTGYDRLEKAKAFAKENELIIVLKGANTATCLPNGETYFNSTGNPGMATGGSGDVLTGVILGLLTQGYSPKEAAIIGVFKHGESGDKTKATKGEYALIASDLIENLRIDS